MKDPTKVPVQLNVKIPWDFRQFLSEKSKDDRVSLNQLVSSALDKSYGAQFRRSLRADTVIDDSMDTDGPYDPGPGDFARDEAPSRGEGEWAR